MKNICLLLLFITTISSSQIINIPDANFKNRLITANAANGYACIGSSQNTCLPGIIDTNGDGEIQVSEAEAVAVLNINSANISDLTGIEYFTNLEWLACGFNQLTSINVSQLTNLARLQCQNNQITVLDLTNLINLNFLDCKNNQLNSLDVSLQTDLEILLLQIIISVPLIFLIIRHCNVLIAVVI